MDVVGRIVSQGAQVISLEDVEDLERDDALPIGRELVESMSLILGAHRLDPGRAVLLKIIKTNQASPGLEVGGDTPPQVASVKMLDAAGGQLAKSFPEIRLPEDLSKPRGTPLIALAHQVVLCELRNPLVPRSRAPVSGNDLTDGKSILGVADRIGEDVLERQRAVFIYERTPAVKGAGHRHRVRAEGGNAVQPHRAIALDTRLCRRTSTAIQADQLFLFGRPGEHKHVAADARTHRLHHIQHGGSSNRRIEGVAPLSQNCQPGRGRQRLAGADGPPLSQHH